MVKAMTPTPGKSDLDMKTHRVQVVWAHPRADSLTASVVDEIVAELRAQGADVDELDLYRSGFDPVLGPSDEPDWGDLD